RPITQSVRDYLIPVPPSAPVDFTDTWIVVPTRQASRRLRETLAAHCAANDTALLSAQVIMPAAFFRANPLSNLKETTTLLTQAVWAEILHTALPSDFQSLFPASGIERNRTWAERTAETLQQLRNALADGGYTIQDVMVKHADTLDEPDRWQDLAEAEKRYLARVEALGYKDATLRKITQASEPYLPEEIQRLVVASVPDPSLLMIRALEALQDTHTIDVLITAPAEQSDRFDLWGRPKPEPWQTRSIDIPDADQTVILAGTPKSQAERAIREVAVESTKFGPGDIAIGVPDRTVIPFLETTLTERGIPTFDPTEKSLRDHPIYGTLNAFATLHSQRSYAALRDLVRHPDVLAYLLTQNINNATLLSELDAFQGEHLPLRLDDVLVHLHPNHGESLKAAMAAITSLLGLFDNATPAGAARELLQTLYRKRLISSRDPEDQTFAAAAEKVAEILRELEECEGVVTSLDTSTALRLLLQRLAEQTYHADREDSQIDLEGWLELPWNNAPFLIVTGMNEGRVPDGRLSDIFLPDSLRTQLGLRNDAGRLARDAYLMTLMIETRRDSGKALFIIGKTSAAGDPLKPSRLLFRCPASELAKRAEILFAPVEEHAPHHASTVSFKLDPLAPYGDKPLTNPLSKLSVTAFRSYLTCPFRFYLGHVLRMRALDDSKRELDALDFGTMMHTALEKMATSAMWREDDAIQLSDFLIGEVEALVAQRFPSPAPLPVQITLEAARQRLRQAASVQVQLVRDGWDLIQTEGRHTMELGGVTIRGTVDRVDQHRDSGAIRVIDYKTSDREITPLAAHLANAHEDTAPFAQVEVDGKAKRWIDLQLPLYHHLLTAGGILTHEAELAYFNLPKAVMQTGLSIWEGLTPALLESAYHCAEAIVGQISNGVFWPPAEHITYDDYATLFPAEAEACFEPIPTPGEPEIGGQPK
ncbi:MAG: hypothetical protein HN341_17790, partial [Verrucomicrobia bacterium]|nr:hypothetical protein [Verrucomicrobiota bacterium]